MELSRDAIKLLRWLNKYDQWSYLESIQKKCKYYEYRSFSALIGAGFVDATVFDDDYKNPEYDENYGECFLEHYRISDKGKAFLEGIASRKIPEFREWIAIAVSAIALIVSIVALVNDRPN